MFNNWFCCCCRIWSDRKKKKCNASQVWSCDRERERKNETGGVGQRQSKWSRCEKRDQNKSQTTLLFLFLWLLLLCCCYLRFLPSLLLIMICYRVVIAVVAVSPLLASFICLIVLQWPRPRFMQMCKNDFNCRGERDREREGGRWSVCGLHIVVNLYNKNKCM